MLCSTPSCKSSHHLRPSATDSWLHRTQILFTADPVLIVARSQACWVPAIVSTLVWGYAATKFRTIREPLLLGFILFTGGLIGLTTIQPGQSVTAIAMSCLVGLGFGAPLVLIVTGVQLSTPHRLIATATACTTSSRAIAGAVFSAINTAAFESRLTKYLPGYISKATLGAGLPASSLVAFITALTTGDAAGLSEITGVTPEVISRGTEALRQAYADSFRVVFIIAVPFGVLACIGCCFLGDLKETMDLQVDASVEKPAIVHGKDEHGIRSGESQSGKETV